MLEYILSRIILLPIVGDGVLILSIFIGTGATRTKDAKELLYARQHIVTVAKAYRLQAIDLVHIDFKGKLLKKKKRRMSSSLN